MSKCLNGIESIEFESAQEQERFNAYLQFYDGNLDKAQEAYLTEKVERDTELAEQLSKYTLPGFTPSQQHQVLSGFTYNIGQSILSEIERTGNVAMVEKIFANEFKVFRVKLTRAHNAGNTALANEYVKVLSNWKALEEMTLSNLKNLGIHLRRGQRTNETQTAADTYTDEALALLQQAKDGLDVSELDEDGDIIAEGEDSNYERTKWEDDSVLQIQAKDRSSARLRMFMGRVPEMARDEGGDLVPRHGYLGFMRYVPFDSLWEIATAFLSGRDPHFDTYIEAMQDSGNGSLIQLADMLIDADPRVQSEFVTAMSKFYIDMFLVTHSPVWSGGEITSHRMKLMRSNRNSVADSVISSWISNQKTSPLVVFNENGEMMLDFPKIHNIQNYYEKAWPLLQGKGMNRDKLEFVQRVLDSLGITLTIGQVESLQKNSKKVFNGSFDYMFNPAEKKSFISTLFDDFSPKSPTGEESLFALSNPLLTNRGGRIKKLAEFVASESEHLMTPSYRDVERKHVHPYQDEHLLSATIRKLQTDSDFLKRMTSGAFSGSSLWAKRLLESESDRSLLSMTYMDGMKKVGSRRAQKRKHMSEAEQHLYSLALFQNAQFTHVGDDVMASFIVPTQSDKSVSPIVSFVKQNIDVTIEDGRVTVFSRSTTDTIMNGVWAEARRIKDFQENLEGRMGDNFEAYQKGAKKFFLHPWLNKEAMTEKDAGLVWGSDGSLLSTPTAMNVLVRLTTEAYLQKIENIQEMWRNNGVVNTTDSGKVVPMMSLPYLNSTGRKDMADKIAHAAADYVLNYGVFYAEYFMLVAGDPALHFNKDVETTLDNVQKRLAKDIAPTLRGKWKFTDTFRKITIGDRVVDSKDRALYEKVLGEDFYKSIESTDAQEYTTLEEHIKVMRAYGKIAEPVFKSIMTKIKANRGGYFELVDEERDVVLQPMKPLTVNMRHIDQLDVDGNDVPVRLNMVVYTKSSSFPLLPELTRGLEIDKLRVAMEKGGIDRAAHVSADKLGIQIVESIYSNDGKLQDNLEFNNYQTLTREGFGLQQEMPVKILEISTISQMNKFLFEGVRELQGFKFQGKEYSGSQLENLKEDVRKRLFEAGAESLRSDLGLVPNGDGSFRFENLHKVREILTSEAKSRGWSKSDIESLELTEDGTGFIVPLAFSHASPRIESLLLSMIKKRITHGKMFGKGFVQASSAGFESVGGQDNILWVPGFDPTQGLRHMRWDVGNNVMPAQIVVPWYFKGVDMRDYVDEDGALDIERLNPEVLQIIGARIPNQGHSSMAAFEIVGFIDPAFKSLAIVPDEIVAQMGSDFDIDKLYTYLTQYEIVEDGLIDKLSLESEGELSVAQLKQIYADLHWSVLNHYEVSKKAMLPLERDDLAQEKGWIRKAKKEESLRAPVFVDTQIADHIKNRAGKELVARFSLYSTAQSVLQPYNVIFAKDPDTKERLSDAFVFVDEDGKKIKVDRLSGSGVAKYGKNKAPRSKAQNIASLQSAAVDNAKDNILGFLNLNMTTVSIAGLMAMLESQDGDALSLAHIARFLSQPAIILITDNIVRYQSAIRNEFVSDPVEEAISFVTNEIYQKDPDLVGELKISGNAFSPKQMLKMIEDWSKFDNLSKPDRIDLLNNQLQIIRLFESLHAGSRLFDSFRRALLFADSNGAGKSVPMMNDQRDAIGNLSQMGFSFDQTLLESEYAKAAKHALELGGAYFNQLFGYDTVFFKSARNILSEGLNVTMDPDDQQRLMNDIRSFLYSQTGAFGNRNEQMRRLTMGDNTLAHRVRSAKDSEWGQNNYLLQRLQPEISESKREPSRVTYQASKVARLDEEEILRAWSGLLTSPDVAQRKLASDLVVYSYLIGGRFSPQSFSQHVPVAYLRHIGFDSALRNITLDDPVMSDRFVDQYIQHNPTITPNVRGNKKIMKMIQGADSFLISPDEVSIDEILTVDQKMVRAFHVGRANGAASLWVSRGEQADGNYLFEKVDILGDSNVWEYNANAVRAKSVFPGNQVKPLPNSKRSVRPPQSTPMTDMPTSMQSERPSPMDGVSNDLQDMISVDYPIMSGIEKAFYALDRVSKSPAIGIVPFLRAAVQSLGNDFDLIIDEAADDQWGAANYSSTNHRVTIYQNRTMGKAHAEKLLIHELLHAVTATRLQNRKDPMVERFDMVLQDVIKAISSREDADEYRTFLKKMRASSEAREPLTQKELHQFYPLLNIHEFAVGIFSDPNFVRYIKDIKSADGDRSVWENIIHVLTNLISNIAREFGVIIPPDSAVREAMEIALQFFPVEIGDNIQSEQAADNSDQFQYYGASYTILLRRDERQEDLYAYDVEGYRGKADRKARLLEAYNENPDVDPQNGKYWRNEPRENANIEKDAAPETSSSVDTKYDLGNGMVANTEQREAINKLSRFLDDKSPGNKVFVLEGRGGTGKTTIVSKVLSSAPGASIMGAAISHVAANQLAHSIPESMTVAKLIGIRLDENTGQFFVDKWTRSKKGVPIHGADVIIIDETSMISEELMFEILSESKENAKIIFMGDNVQLPPIGNDVRQSATFEANDSPNNKARLVERMRSGEDHPLVPISDLLAKNIESDTSVLRVIPDEKRVNQINDQGKGILFENDLDSLIDAYIEDLANIGDAADPVNWARIVTFNNERHTSAQSVGTLNRKIRERIYGEKRANSERFIPGEVVTSYSMFNPEDTNQSSKYSSVDNSESFRIESISSPFKKNIQIRVKGEYGAYVYNDADVWLQDITMIDSKGRRSIVPVVSAQHRDVFSKFYHESRKLAAKPMAAHYAVMRHVLYMQPAYAITSHKAQSQTYNNVYVMEDNILGPSNGSGTRAKNQSLYTAITRASQKLVMYSANNPEQSPIQSENEADIMRKDSPFLMPATSDFGTTVDQVMRDMSSEQRQVFRSLRAEGFIRTKCD